MKHNIGQHLNKRAHISANKEAYIEVERARRFTYAQLNSRSNKIANSLTGIGVKQGDRIAVLLKNGIEFIESYFAAAKIGAVLVPINWRLVAAEIDYILQDSGAETLIFDADFDSTVEKIKTPSVNNRIRVNAMNSEEKHQATDYDQLLTQANDNEPAINAGDDDLLFIMYTSGTTGRPKGAMISHNNMLWSELTSMTTSDMRGDDRFLLPLPMFHVGCLNPVSLLTHRGATGIVMRDIDMETMFRAIDEEKVTITMSVPALLQFMLVTPEREKYDISSIRWIATGAAPVPVSLLKQYETIGIRLFQAYGLTESCGPGTLLLPEDAEAKVGSCGKAQMHTQLRVVDEQGNDVKAGKMGELILAGKHIMQGYWNLPEATAETLKDGWLYTGDVCSIDEDGFVTIRDRKKDMIISGGENIYPAELENVLAGNPEVQEAAVIGISSNKWGEVPLAIIVAAANQSPNEDSILAFCRENLAAYKIPKVIKFVDSLPRNPSGKLLKPQLREMFNEPAPE